MTSEIADSRSMSSSRRRLLQAGAVTLGAGLLGMQGALPGWAADPISPIGGGIDGTGAGADGAPPPPGAAHNRTLVANAAPTDPTSYNGWTVGTPASAIGVQNYTVPGTNVVLPIRSGDVASVLLYVARRFNDEVEKLDRSQCWGYDYRPNVNNPSVWSNHASGTAIDLNAVKHPNGVAGTFSTSQKAAVRKILAFCGEVIYWGEDYRGTIDGMHFEIDVPPGSASLAALVRKIGGGANPLGNLDVLAYLGDNKVRVSGWAFDPDVPATQIPIDIYADGVGISRFPTGISRQDVNSAFGITGDHGFDVQIQLAPGNHTVAIYGINAGGGTLNPLIGVATVQVGLNPVGYLDSVTSFDSDIRITGWAFDPDNSAAEIQVAVYMDGAGVDWFPTGKARPDVNAFLGARGNHGFDISIKGNPGNHRIEVFAGNVGGGTGNPSLGSKQVLVGVPPQGWLDSVVADGRTVRIRGWAYDADQPGTEIPVAIYRNNIGISWFPTGGSRSDVNAAFGIPGNHGFDISVNNIPAGDQSFSVFAINAGPAGTNPLLGVRSVRVG
ncbi:MAG: M15 family metallopeptidase [Nakamurella sp.]